AFGYSNFTNLLTRIRLEEINIQKKTKQPFNDCLILFIYSLSTGFDKEPHILTDISRTRKDPLLTKRVFSMQ
ncbi:hypothetical protein, partial [Lactobacillus helveticus]|uniref:hypothetical protein n=2 Tax=Lactobacillus helveticus TaxID=1587 RepID=UPI001E528258